MKLQRLWRTASPGIVAVALLIVPPPAGAHLRSGTVAVDYRASVSSSRASAYSAQVFQSDRALGVTIKPGHVVVLVGYLGEPVFRLDAAGLWQDSRAQGLPPGVRRGDWSVPLIVDGQRSAMRGELHRLPAPVLFRGPERWCVAGAIGTGLVALAVGLLDGAVFLHPIVLAILPAGVVRLTGLVAIGAGLDAAALGALFYAETDMPGAGERVEPKGAFSDTVPPLRS